MNRHRQMSNLVLKIRELTSLPREKFAARTGIDEDSPWSIMGDDVPELLP